MEKEGREWLILRMKVDKRGQIVVGLGKTRDLKESCRERKTDRNREKQADKVRKRQ